MIVAIGVTRVYLGAHYPTDVLAGWLTGAAIVLAPGRSPSGSRSRGAQRGSWPQA